MTLTETSVFVKRGLVVLAIVAFLYYLALLFLFPMGKKIIANMFPDKDPPTLLYGSLPPLEFFEKKIKSQEQPPTYKLDTNDGRLPSNIPTKMPVFRYVNPIPFFEKGKNASNSAAHLGFTDDELTTSLKEINYKWYRMESSGNLEINVDTRALTLNTPLLGSASYFPSGNLTQDQAQGIAKQMFSDIGRFGDNLYKSGYQTVKLGRFLGNRIVKTESTFDAQIARVDFFRKLYDFPILGPDPTEGLLYTYLRVPQGDNKYYNFPIVQSYNWELQEKTSATYPVISVSQAWDNVSRNNGVIVNVTPKGSSNISPYSPVTVESIFVNEIYIAFYDTPKLQQYLQPIYVFSGKYTTIGTQGGTITLYYPAIPAEHIKPN